MKTFGLESGTFYVAVCWKLSFFCIFFKLLNLCWYVYLGLSKNMMLSYFKPHPGIDTLANQFFWTICFKNLFKGKFSMTYYVVETILKSSKKFLPVWIKCCLLNQLVDYTCRYKSNGLKSSRLIFIHFEDS